MDQRVTGGWFALLRPPGRGHVTKDCTDEATGRAGCEAWALRHLAALQAYAEHRNLMWLANQTWRGQDKTLARELLEALERKAPGAPASLQGPARLDCALDGEGGRPGDSRGRSGSDARAPYVAGGSRVTHAAAA